MIKVHLIAAARPNFMKVAPLFHALSRTDWVRPALVHTGQHYDTNMSDVFFQDLQLPEPTHHLGVGSGSHAEQTGGVMIAYEKVCHEDRPDWIVVVGDVNSTAACAQVGTKLWIPVIHLEAGLRSGDRRMPEEINRLVTDAIADVLWTPSADADENLAAEGINNDKIDLIGNIMIDSFEMLRDKIEASNTAAEVGLTAGEYALATLHRPSNVDALETLTPIIDALQNAAATLPVVFVAHPRTINALEKFGLKERIESDKNIRLLNPLPYVSFMNVVTGAKVVITDSGGLQEETTYLGIPCLTLRDNTERPVTVTLGTNKLVSAGNLGENLTNALAGDWPTGQKPPLWTAKQQNAQWQPSDGAPAQKTDWRKYMTVPLAIRWVITFALVAAVIILSVIPGQAQAGDSRFVWLVAATPTLVQKIMHFLVYGTLAGLCAWSLEGLTPYWLRAAIAFSLAVGLGAALEWYQTQIPGRFGTLFDVALNTVGVIAGLIVAALFF